MKVIATDKGYYGQVREAGDEFEVKDGDKGSWFKPVATATKDEKPSGKAAPKGQTSDPVDVI